MQSNNVLLHPMTILASHSVKKTDTASYFSVYWRGRRTLSWSQPY